ncbi:MAG: hypothetical protein ACI9ZV_000208, partial [Candidatus Azotimanducaceae bacterium]
DLGAAYQDLGYKPGTEMQAALSETIRDLKERGF